LEKVQGLLFYISLLILSFPISAQKSDKKPLLEPSVRKSGPYFGLQQGLFLVGEIGMEAQFKEIKFKQPKTHGLHAGLEFNIPNKALGANAGFWHKPSRFDLTYGFDVALRSNFEAERYGIAPVIGYKLFGLHVRAGYMLLTPSKIFTETNQLFINARFIVVNKRDFKWNKRKKKKKK